MFMFALYFVLSIGYCTGYFSLPTTLQLILLLLLIFFLILIVLFLLFLIPTAASRLPFAPWR
jgi:hypothetical protein